MSKKEGKHLKKQNKTKNSFSVTVLMLCLKFTLNLQISFRDPVPSNLTTGICTVKSQVLSKVLSKLVFSIPLSLCQTLLNWSGYAFWACFPYRPWQGIAAEDCKQHPWHWGERETPTHRSQNHKHHIPTQQLCNASPRICQKEQAFVPQLTRRLCRYAHAKLNPGWGET